MQRSEFLAMIPQKAKKFLDDFRELYFVMDALIYTYTVLLSIYLQVIGNVI